MTEGQKDKMGKTELQKDKIEKDKVTERSEGPWFCLISSSGTLFLVPVRTL